MGLDDISDGRIHLASVHGYATTHETGFENDIRAAFSRSPKYDVELVKLPGHEPGQEHPEWMPFTDVIEGGIERITKIARPNTYLMGISIGGKIAAEAIRRGAPAKGLIYIKPVLDANYTFRQPCPELEPVRKILKPEEAATTYTWGTEQQPYQVEGLPVLLLSGPKDNVTGGMEHLQKVIQGTNITPKLLERGHNDHTESDATKTIWEITKFLIEQEKAAA